MQGVFPQPDSPAGVNNMQAKMSQSVANGPAFGQSPPMFRPPPPGVNGLAATGNVGAPDGQIPGNRPPLPQNFVNGPYGPPGGQPNQLLRPGMAPLSGDNTVRPNIPSIQHQIQPRPPLPGTQIVNSGQRSPDPRLANPLPSGGSTGPPSHGMGQAPGIHPATQAQGKIKNSSLHPS